MSATRRAIFALPAALSACGAVAVAKTPLPSMEAMVAEVEALWRQRDAIFKRYIRQSNGHCYVDDPAYFAEIRPIEARADDLIMRLARTEANTPTELQMKAKIAVAHHPFSPKWETGNPAAEILNSLFRDLGVAV